jgi:hypothetical protein
MSKKTTQAFILLFSFILVLTGKSLSSEAQEAVVFDQTVDWAWPISDVYGGNSFYWWHYTFNGHTSNNLGDMPTDDWTTPFNYRYGNFYMRIEVISQPSSSPFFVEMGIWQDGTLRECITDGTLVSGGAGSVAEVNMGTYDEWWHKPDPEGGIQYTDFTRPEDFNRIGLILWKGNKECIPMGQGWTNAAMCADGATDQASFFPMNVRITVVAVAQGHTFSGWDAYTGGGAQRQPTPTYTVDYGNERTNQTVPSTDEYSYYSNMSPATDGTGVALDLTPGQNVYFRTKASGEILASYVQSLTVKSRPSAPNFGYDATNQRTSTTVSSDYEYSDNADMSGAVSGSGNYVSFAIGTTKYFRKKATSSNFKSNIQTLTGTSGGSGGSGDPSNIGPEFVIINKTIDFPYETSDNGFYFFFYDPSMPSNWLSNYDYFNGQIYTRYEIISQATNEPVDLQFGIWQRIPVGSEDINDLYENMEPRRSLNGPGSIATNNSSPSTWWKTSNGGADFTKMDLVWHFGISPWQSDPLAQIRSENAAVWAERGKWFPMQVKVTVIAVADGYVFSGWDNYLQTETAPEYQIDYTNERTATQVSSADEYSYNQSAWTGGTDGYLTLTPGQDAYFRKKNGTLVQHLVVPTRPAAPAYTINYTVEKTVENIPATVQYANNSGFSSAQDGTGVQLNVTPGTTIYFRYKSTSAAFASPALTLTAPARPTITSPLTSPTNVSPIAVKITFPSAVNGFESSDLLVTNGSVASVSGTYTVNITPTASGLVSITVKSNAVNEGNFASAAFSIEYAEPTGLENTETGMFRLYPTLSESYIILESKDHPNGSYQIFDAGGNRVGRGLVSSTTQEINTVSFSPGIYQLVVIANNKTETFRFIKVKY